MATMGKIPKMAQYILKVHTIRKGGIYIEC